MVLIADSGASKTDWLLLNGKELVSFTSKGLNPIVFSAAFIKEQLVQTFGHLKNRIAITRLYFFGAGCWNDTICQSMKHQLAVYFPAAKIEVQSDMMGAIRATCGEEEGVVCILGTGSNSCWFNGSQIQDAIPSLGFLIGDEGSGTYLGKQLLRHFFYRELPPALEKAMIEGYQLDKQQLIKEVYGKKKPNRYLASFAPFLKEYIHHPFVRKILKDSFEEFLVRHVLKYSIKKTVPIHFIGSIAFHFQEILLEVLSDHQLKVGRILEQPIFGLKTYYTPPNHLSL